MEPLSVTASIIAVLQAANSVVCVCYDYSAAVKNAPWELSRVTDEVISLRNVLEALVDLAKKAESAVPMAATKLPKLMLLCGSNSKPGPLDNCLDELRGLRRKLDSPKWAGADGSKTKAFIQAVTWPLKEGETTKTLEKISRFKATLNLALTVDNATLTLEIQNMMQAVQSTTSIMQEDVVKMHQSLTSFQIDSHRKDIHRWLSAPDPSSNHSKALEKRHPNTGEWFIRSKQFADWKITPNSTIWLYGIPGCGKTILSSTIIEEILNQCSINSAHATAYFYFDFNDIEKQLHEKMIRSLIVQISMSFAKTPQSLQSLFSDCENGKRQPSTNSLLMTLQQMVEKFDSVFFILDALDECNDRPALLENLEIISQLGLRRLHILATSRREKDIDETLGPLVGDQGRISIQSAVVNHDIRAYIHTRIHADKGLKRWRNYPNVQQEIEDKLMDGADGMFRWAVCQLDTLGKCLNLPMLQKALASLPKTLHDTYARILYSIDDDYRKYALKILQWLVYSLRPLGIDEIIDVIAVDLEEQPRFDPARRLPDPEEVLTICPSLITIVLKQNYRGDEITEVKLAHFSVKEYLVSGRVHDAWYSIQEIDAHISIAEVCVAYLVHFQSPDPVSGKNSQNPLHLYATAYWARHARIIDDYNRTSSIIEEFVLVHKVPFQMWVQSCFWPGNIIQPSNTGISLFHLSAFGLSRLVRLMCESGADVNIQPHDLQIALYGASSNGHERMVTLLLENGADVNAQPEGRYDVTPWQDRHLPNKADVRALPTALFAASENNQLGVVKLLLGNGADINAQLGRLGSALDVAVQRGNEALVNLFLENRADVDDQLRQSLGTALYVASERGHGAMVKLLLKNGANVNTPCGEDFGNALYVASPTSRLTIEKLLIENSANVNTPCGEDFGNALYVASTSGRLAIVKLLLENGADINIQFERLGNALYAAVNSYHYKLAMVKLLLENGADVNAQLGKLTSALYLASKKGYEEVVQLFLENGADVNLHTNHGTALYVASEEGHEAVVKLLLKNGADVHAQHHRSPGAALYKASSSGHETVVKLLLENGADVNAQAGHLGTALYGASATGHESVVKLLLKNGADVDTRQRLDTALYMATWDDYEAVVKVLLENGADIDAKNYSGKTALQKASQMGRTSIARLLLEKGAAVNVRDNDGNTALKIAMDKGYEPLAQLLVENGAHLGDRSDDYEKGVTSVISEKSGDGDS